MATTAFPSRSLSVDALFRRAVWISVPLFQRPYSWTLHEAGQLLEDIAAAAGSHDAQASFLDYFLGTVLMLCPRPLRLVGDESFSGTFAAAEAGCEIIDGQQRLVTLTILAAVLRDLDEAQQSPIRDRLAALIGSDGATEAGGEAYRVRLPAREQRFFSEFVLAPGACAEMPANEGRLLPSEAAILETREHFMSELSHLSSADRDRLALYLLDHCHLVVIATDEIDRAHRIFVVLNGRGLPLERDDILKAEIVQGMPHERAVAALKRWDAVALRLGPNFKTLFAHIRTIHGETRPQIIAAIRSVIAVQGAEAFITGELEPLGEALAAVSNPWDEASTVDTDIRRRLVYLNRLNGADWIPAAMLALRLHASDPARASMLMAGIDRLAHATRLMCMGTGKRQQRFAAVVRAILDGSLQPAHEGPFQLSRDDLRVLQFNLRDLHSRAPSVCKLLLMRLDDEITGLLPSLKPSDFSVEHVMPLRPPANSGWRRVIPDPTVRAAAMQSLGNLTLLTAKQNDQARNEDFDRKRAIYMAPEPGRPILAITREIIDTPVWGLDEILAREARMTAQLAQALQLPITQPLAQAMAALPGGEATGSGGGHSPGEAEPPAGRAEAKRRTGTG